MNYCYRDYFSKGEFSSANLNSTHMDEHSGLGTTDQNMLAFLQGKRYGYDRYGSTPIDTNTGAIDWNRNGRIDSGYVRAAATWNFLDDGAQQGYMSDADIYYSALESSYSALAFYPNHPEPSSIEDSHTLLWFTRRLPGSSIGYRYATIIPDNDHANWYPPMGEDPCWVSYSYLGKGAPAAAYFDGQYFDGLVLVFKKAHDNKLWYMTAVYPDTSSQSCLIWLGPRVVSNEDVIGSPAAVTYMGKAYLYAVGHDGYLREYVFDPPPKSGMGAFGFGNIQYWYSEDGGVVEAIPAKTGPGLTFGAIRDGYNSYYRIVAAIPMGIPPKGQIEIAWKDPNVIVHGG